VKDSKLRERKTELALRLAQVIRGPKMQKYRRQGQGKSNEELSQGAVVQRAPPPGIHQHHARGAAALAESGIREGLCLVNAMHITASVFINDDEPGLLGDWERWLEKLAPEQPYDQYRHNDSGEDNADSHLKRTIMGREVVCSRD